MKFSDVLEIKNGRNQKQVENPNGKYPIYGSGGIMGYADDYICEPYTVIIGRKGTINNPIYVETPFWNVDTAFGLQAKKDILHPKYLYYFCVHFDFEALNTTVTIPSLTKANLLNIDIPLPPLVEQTEIVDTLTSVDELIKIKKQQLELFDELTKSRFIELFGDADYPQVLFENVCAFLRNGANIKQTKGAGGYPITRIETLSNDVFNIDRLGYADITDLEKYQSYILHHGDILISHINSIAYLGRAVQYRGQLDTPIIHGMNLLCARIADSYNPTYIEWFFKTPMAKEYISTITKKAVNQASITTSDLKKMQVPNPPKNLQDQFAAFVEQTDKSKMAVQQSIAELEELKKSLMQKYFG
ncbi:MAG: restriction endonuclease subunit S [Oscillospiraceae bacterium]|nr:restriction endonuclease subunit S [Oscillospiraceae bacterium]